MSIDKMQVDALRETGPARTFTEASESGRFGSVGALYYGSDSATISAPRSPATDSAMYCLPAIA